MTLKIIKTPDPILRQKCAENFIISDGLIGEMFELMRKSNGVGLAAPQVGFAYRLFVVSWGEVFINPVITKRAGHKTYELEGCLSVPGFMVRVQRHQSIVVNGKHAFDGMMARVIQHELDHLDGKLITDYLQCSL